jgi:hypothetical protein
VFYYGRARGIAHVRYIECSSAGVQQVVAKKLKGYEFMLLSDELTGPADKLNRLQKKATRFVEWAEEKMEVAGLNADKLRQQARKAYKTAQPIINAKIDARLLASSNICNVWEVATPEQAQERKEEWDARKKSSINNYTHGMGHRRTLARAMMLSPDEAGVWSDDIWLDRATICNLVQFFRT